MMTQLHAQFIENIRQFNLVPVVAINRFVTDAPQELELIKEYCASMGVRASIVDVWSKGGAGAIELAELLMEQIAMNPADHTYKPLYDLNLPVREKIEIIAKKIYGAQAVDYTAKAKADLKKIADLGLEHLAICMAKTQKSLSDNPELLGRPKDFVVTVREIEVASGAGFIIPITGEIMRMPGLPEEPAAERIDIDENGVISGLF